MQRLDHFLTLGALQEPSRPFLRGNADWTYAQANEEVNDRAARFRRESAGLPVCLRGANNALWVINLLALLRANVPAILVPQGITEQEAAALMRMAGTQLKIEEDQCLPTGVSSSGLPDWLGQDVGLGFATSGSTGEPRIALRSHASLTDEGLRYQALWQATPHDVFFAVAPLYHAYTFGAALAAALAAGATLAVASFKSAHVVSTNIQDYGATILPLVPIMARALALVDQGQPVRSNLRIVMAGAGQTTEELSSLFALRWGVALSRNYGSSETGAILASLAPVTDEATGEPMRGITCELVEGSRNSGSPLWVRLTCTPSGYLTPAGYEPAALSPGRWWAMGDLFERTPRGGLRLLGRQGTAIRRAGRAIQPREIEATLLSMSAVSEVYVKGSVDWNGEECVEAHIALKQPGSIGAEDLHQYLTNNLAAYKVPNRWYFYDELPKTWSDKVSTRHLLSARSSKSPSLMQIVSGFRLPHAVFAAQEIGLVEELEKQSQSTETLASKLSCDVQALGVLLEYLSFAGVLNATGTGYKLARKPDSDWAPISRLEGELRSTWLSPEQIVSVLRTGLRGRSFEQDREFNNFSRLYIEAFCGPWQEVAGLLLQRKLRLPNNGTALEIGRAAGRIALQFRNSFNIDCQFCALGPAPSLAWPSAEQPQVHSWDSLPLAPASFDAIILTNTIHWLTLDSAPAVLNSLVAALRSNGALVIVDIFVDTAPESPRFLLDWLTHGGLNWTRLGDLKLLLSQAGLSSVETQPIAEGAVQLVTCRRSAQSQQSLNLTSAKGQHD